MIVTGALIAVPSAWVLKRFVEAQLFGVTSMDLPTIAVAGAIIAAVGFGAALIPAWRAATLNPIEALRV
jgi:ABC-type antimicrobial peptide transport system permease subunit